MPRIVATHAVVDLDRWLEGKAERAAAIESGSGSNVVDHVAQDGSNNIAITADVSDLAALGALLSSPSPEVAARDGGARGRPADRRLRRGVGPWVHLEGQASPGPATPALRAPLRAPSAVGVEGRPAGARCVVERERRPGRWRSPAS